MRVRYGETHSLTPELDLPLFSKQKEKSCEAPSTAQNAWANALVILNLIGREEDLVACRILLICMIPKFVPRLRTGSNFGNGVSGTAFPVKVAHDKPLHTNHNMSLYTHAEMIYPLRSRFVNGQTSISSDASVNC